jgi:hypothetical protein
MLIQHNVNVALILELSFHSVFSRQTVSIDFLPPMSRSSLSVFVEGPISVPHFGTREQYRRRYWRFEQANVVSTAPDSQLEGEFRIDCNRLSRKTS